jgi:isopenicillin N synthase-like dioxygenase
MPLPIIDLNSNPSIEKLTQVGGCFVPIPEQIQKNLETIKQTSDQFFALPLDVKQQHPKTPDSLGGYLNQSHTGYDIERYINRGDIPENMIMQEAQACIEQTRVFLKEQILLPFLTALLNDINIAKEQYAFHFKDFENTVSIIHYPPQDTQPDRLPAHADAA